MRARSVTISHEQMLRGLVNTFAGNPLDRASDKRINTDWLATAEASPDAKAVFLRRGDPLLEANGEDERRIADVSMTRARSITGGEAMFLGLRDGAPVFAIDAGEAVDAAFGDTGVFEDLRLAALTLPAGEAAICATAKAMLAWHGRHRFCANCGAATRPADGG